jgi:hypothetical protein
MVVVVESAPHIRRMVSIDVVDGGNKGDEKKKVVMIY